MRSPRHALHPELEKLLPLPCSRGEGRGEGSPSVVYPAVLSVELSIPAWRRCPNAGVGGPGSAGRHAGLLGAAGSRESAQSSNSRCAPEPIPTILRISAKWSATAWPLLAQASFAFSITGWQLITHSTLPYSSSVSVSRPRPYLSSPLRRWGTFWLRPLRARPRSRPARNAPHFEFGRFVSCFLRGSFVHASSPTGR